MTSPCTNCIHGKVCRDRHLIEAMTKTIDASLGHIEIRIEDKACSVKDIPWIDMDRLALICKNYWEDPSYKMAIQMAQANMNCINPYYQPCNI